MRSITSAFRRALADDRRDYVCRAVITLIDDTEIEVDGSRIWEGGFGIEDAVSNDNTFDVGAAIINKATLVLNNIYEEFSPYDFTDAIVEMYVGLDDLDDGTDEEILLGTYTVDEPQYDGSIITLSCLDNMVNFDKPYRDRKSVV